MKNKTKSAFSLIELSIVIIIIGVLIVGITKASNTIAKFRIETAKSLTMNSPVQSIKGLVLWFDVLGESALTNAANSHNIEDGDYIKNWTESNPLFAESLNFTTSSSDYYPVYLENKFNGLPVLSFDGVNDSLDIEPHDRITRLENLNIFIVFSFGEVGLWQGILVKQAGTSVINGSVIGNPPYEIRIKNDTMVNYTVRGEDNVSKYHRHTLANPSLSKPLVVSANNNDALRTSELYVNGILRDSESDSEIATVSSQLTIGQQKKGHNRFAKCYIAEIIMFNKKLNSEDRRYIEEYLGQKWGIDI